MNPSNYDCTEDVMKHIGTVRLRLMLFVQEIIDRAIYHDLSKLQPPEKEVYDKYTPLLKDTEYGSAKYKALLKAMSEGVNHHWTVNRHHPEFFPNGIDGMNLIDLVELLSDWKAAGERTKNGDIKKSIEINTERFNISPQLKNILINTAEYLGW